MIAHVDDTPVGDDSLLLVDERLADSTKQALASFIAVNESLESVGQLTIEYGVGRPLCAFQALLRTYKSLVQVGSSLSLATQSLLTAAKGVTAA
jgi:hypothetical protein